MDKPVKPKKLKFPKPQPPLKKFWVERFILSSADDSEYILSDTTDCPNYFVITSLELNLFLPLIDPKWIRPEIMYLGGYYENPGYMGIRYEVKLTEDEFAFAMDEYRAYVASIEKAKLEYEILLVDYKKQLAIYEYETAKAKLQEIL